jgi:hypothetical protein
MWQQQRQNFKDLSQALQAGDLGTAQKAFASLAANSPNASNPNSPLGRLGQALQSGDLAAAQQAFASMHAGGHHHHHSASAQAGSGTPATPPASGSTGTIVNTVA